MQKVLPIIPPRQKLEFLTHENSAIIAGFIFRFKAFVCDNKKPPPGKRGFVGKIFYPVNEQSPVYHNN